MNKEIIEYIYRIITQYEYICIHSQNAIILNILRDKNILYQLDSQSVLSIIHFLINHPSIQSQRIKKQLRKYERELGEPELGQYETQLDKQQIQTTWLVYPIILLSIIDLATLTELQKRNKWQCKINDTHNLYRYNLQWIIECVIKLPITVYGRIDKSNEKQILSDLFCVPLTITDEEIIRVETLISFHHTKKKKIYIPIIIQNKGEN